MRHIFILIITSLFIKTNCAQKITFFIIGDNVNIRQDTTFTSKNIFQVNWGTKYQGVKVSGNWYSFFNEFHSETRYMSAKYVVEEDEFYNLAEEKSNKNGRTKYELLLHYKKNNSRGKAESLLIDIINNNSRELIMMGFENCDLLGPKSYITMLKNNEGYVNYEDSDSFALTNNVIENSKDSLITAIAMIDKVKFSVRNGNLLKAEELLFQILLNFPQNLIIPIPCDYDLESKIYPKKKLINLFLSISSIVDKPKQQEIFEKINELRENSTYQETKNLAQDIYRRLVGDYWLPY